MTFATGDAPILWALYHYRFLQSGQLARLVGRSSQVIRRRVRKSLRKEGYVVELPREPTQESVYALGPRGFSYIAEILGCLPRNLPYSKHNAKVTAQYSRHSCLVNNTRIDLELGLADHSTLSHIRSIPEWEQANVRGKRYEDKFVLYERLSAPENNKSYPFRPDALFIVQYPDENIGLYLEGDRATEGVSSKIRKKYLSYKYYFDKQLYATRFDLALMCILFVLDTPTDRRIGTMQRQLQQLAQEFEDPEAEGPALFVKHFRFTRSEHISPSTFFDGFIWRNWKDEAYALYNPT